MAGRSGRRPGLAAVVLLVAAGCSTPAPVAEGTTSSVAASTAPRATSTTVVDVSGATEAAWSVDIPGAIALGIATNGEVGPVVAWTVDGSVQLASLDGTGALGEAVSVSGDVEPFAHPIERPAVAMDVGGNVTVAFTSVAGADGSVHRTTISGGEVGPTETISGPPRPETVLVHLALDAGGGPVAAWLEDSTLSVARSVDGSMVEAEAVDDLTCDCCHPAPVIVGESLAVAYRDLVRGGDGTRRDVTVVVDDGGGFGEPLAVADDPWFLEACPLAGPSVATVDGSLVVAWMDARQSLHPEQRTSTIWVDRSEGGGTFGVDVAVTDGGAHGVPSLAADGEGRLHLVWETRAPETGLSYARSSDGGATFTEPVTLVPGGEGVVPSSPTAVVHGDALVVSWSDRSGGHVAAWPLADLG